MEAVVLLRVGLVVLLCSFIYSTSSTSSISRTISLTLLMFNYNVYLAFFACVSPFGAYNMNFELCSCLVCMSVCLCIRLFPLWLLQRPLKLANNGTHGCLLGFSWIHMCGVSKKPYVQKLWRGKANMQMSWSSPSAAFAQFRDQRNAAAT